MKERRERWRNALSGNAALCFLLYLALSALAGCEGSAENERLYYALTMDGKNFGYQEAVLSRAETGGRVTTVLKVEGRSLLSALGAEFDTEGHSEYRLGPDALKLVSGEEIVDQGSFKLHITAVVNGDTARIAIDPGGAEKEVALGPDVIFENPVTFPHLLRDFGAGGMDANSYRTLDLLDRKVRDVSYVKKGTEQLELAGRTYPAIILDSLVPETGFKMRLWIDAESGFLLKAEGPRSVLTRAGKSVTRKTVRANLDAHILAKAGAEIADVEALSYLKAKAELEPVGNWITPESLNVPGQSFTGRVKRNRIDGIFEIRHARYDGRNALPFPPALSGRTDLEPFLAPEDFIESDDPVLVGKAKELTAGASDSWDAAKRLSGWVAENIGYDIPGGASARNTYDVKEGECGAHSRLFAAFCRGVGIPARVVWGCMYVPNNGGSFGQHAWNEVYMGDIGWIPIDTTARETDYADSGHIRLGVLSSSHIALNPTRFEIVDFVAGSQKFGESSPPADMSLYEPYLGEFSGPRGVMTVFVQGGGLAIKLADGRTFGLKDPDSEGRWVFKLSQDVHVSFERSESGRVTELTLMNKVRIPKRSAPGTVPDDVPADLRPCLGRYPIPMQKEEITVLYRNGGLALLFPGGRLQPLEGPDADGIWSAKSGTDRFSFVWDEDGTVRAMVLYETIRCAKVQRP
jgi:transglutaminase-like putative cysteine protease